MGPVLHDPPFCSFVDLDNGTISRNQLADFHETMLEEQEYRQRAKDAAEQQPASLVNP